MFSQFRPDLGNFNRLLVWVGFACIVGSILVPWLFYRETGVLTLSQHFLDQLSPTAQRLLRSRQSEIGKVQRHIGLALVGFPLGLVLIVWGALGMYRQQRVEDDRLRAETKVAVRQAELEPQTPEEQEARLVVEQKDEEISSPVATEEVVAPSEPPGGDRAARRTVGGERIERPVVESPRPSLADLRRAEEEILNRLAAIAPTSFRFQSQVKVRTGGASLLLDGVFEAVGPTPDLVVEVKQLRSISPASRVFLRRFVDETLARVVRYRALRGRPSVGWLIILATEAADPRWLASIRSGLAGIEELIAVDVVADPAELKHLPPQAFGPAESLLHP